MTDLQMLVAGHGDLNGAAANAGGDRHIRQTGLGSFHLFLQFLELRHHSAAAAAHAPPIPIGRLNPFAMVFSLIFLFDLTAQVDGCVYQAFPGDLIIF